MSDTLLSALVSIVDLVCDLTVAIDRTQRLGHMATGSDRIVEVPADPKPVPPAARRAIAEAEARQRAREPD